MARILQLFGLLSVLLRGASLTLQSLTVGGVVFLLLVLRGSGRDIEDIKDSCLGWTRRFALALIATQALYLVANTFILMKSVEIGPSGIIGANFVLAGALGLGACFIIVALSSAHRVRSHRGFLLPAVAIVTSSVLTSHAMARLEHRLPLVLVTALHQLATAAWLGALPFLLIAIRRASCPELVRQLSARFSRLALISVAVLASAGLILSFSYVGSLGAVYGTSYGAMVVTKAILFGLLLLLGALNFQLARRGEASTILASLKRFGEAEIGIGVTVILAAASLTSLPPAVDLTQDRVSGPEIYARMTPRPPRLSSPAKKDLPEDVYAAQKRAFEMGSLSTESFVPGQSGTRPNTLAEKAWSEYNHHWAGILVLSVGFLALLAQTGKISWARNWPLLFVSLSIFLFLRSDPEVWPLGPNGFWVTLADPEVLLHRIFAALVVALAAFEWRVQTGRAGSANIRLVFPMLIAVSGALLLTHSHSLGNVKEEVLAELSHIPLAILAVTAGWSRWLELRLPVENRARTWLTWLWPVCISLIGVLLLNYREM